MRMIIPDLLPGTEYAIQVRADNGSTQSQWSNIYIVETTADAIPPSVPEWDLTDGFASIGDTFVAIWQTLDMTEDHNLDFSHYEIELSDGTKSVVVRTTNTSYTLTFEQNGIFFGTPKPTILARVRSVDMVGNVSAWNDLQSATNPAPDPVDSVATTPLYDAIDVRWDAVVPDDFKSFVVQASATSATSGFNVVYDGPNAQYQHASTMFLTDHWFRVYVRDKFNTLSTAVTSGAVRPKSSFEVDTTPPAVPTGLSATIANNPNGVGARAALSWAQVVPAENDLAGFRVRWRQVGDTNWSQTDFSHEDRAGIIELQAAYKNYEFQIRSYDWMGNFSTWTATVTATSPNAGTPGQTVGVASVAGRDSIRYSWTPSTATNLRDYEVTFSTSSTFASGNITFKTGTSPHLEVGGLLPSTTYYARVRAINVAGTVGAWSATHTKATLAQLTPGDIGAVTPDDLDDLVKSYSVEYAVNSSESTAPTTGWSTSTPTRNPGEFIWTRTVVTYNDNTTSITNPALLTGNTGAPGNDGNDGSDGSDGRGIASTAVAYQVGTSGTAEPTGTWSANPVATTAPGQFLWTRTITTYTDATTTTAYSVAAHGAKGADGSDGSDGSDGRGIASTTVNYAKSTNGTVAPSTGWGTNIPATTTGEFLWTRTLITYTDTTTDTAYSVAAHGAKGGDGADGSDGSDGMGISSTAVTYQVGSSGTSEPTGTWLSTVPATAPGEFLWTRTITTYTDSSTTTAYSVSAHGEAGSDGNDGIGISTSTITYQASASGTVAPTGTWTTGIPSVPAGQFLWTRTILTYTDNTTSPPVYAVAGFGANGSDGQDGQDGTDGTNGVSVTALTRYWLRQTTGAGTPTTPGNVASPGESWVTTEPDYLAGTELWMMDRISYSNGTYAYTTPAKSSSYTAAVTAITAANGKNKIVFSTGDATGTAYINGDVWYKKSGTNIVGQWEFISGEWQPRTLSDAVLSSLSVGKLVSGSVSTAIITITNTGSVQSDDYAAGSAGWKLGAGGLEINDGSVRASALIGDTLGSSTGKIQIGAGASIVMNGGFLRSNNYGSDTYNANATAGFFLSDENLHIPDGNISAKALKTGTISGTNTITLSGANAKIKGGSWELSGSGLTIPDGAIEASKLLLKMGNNIMPARQASWEGNPSTYGGGNGYFFESGGVIPAVQTYGGKFGPNRLGAIWGSQGSVVRVFLANSATDYNIPTEAGKTYIFSVYAYSPYALNSTLKVKWSNGTIVTLDSKTLNTDDNPDTATRMSGVATAPAGTTGAAMIWESTTTNTPGGMSLDGAQVEEKVGSSNTPSPWTPWGLTTIEGSTIRTGSIASTALAKRPDGTDISGVPAWSINTAGSAVLGEAQVLGRIVVGQTGNTQAGIRSYNFNNTAGTGWQIDADGHATFNDATVRGHIDGSTITGSDIVGGSFKTAPSGPRVMMSSATSMNPGEVEFWADDSTYSPESGRILTRRYLNSDNSLSSRRLELRAPGVWRPASGGGQYFVTGPMLVMSSSTSTGRTNASIDSDRFSFYSEEVFMDGDLEVSNGIDVGDLRIHGQVITSSASMGLRTGGSGTNAILITPGDNVVFNSQVDIPNMTSGGSANVNYNSNNGRLRVVGSSRRFKDNIRDYIIDPDKVLDLQPRQYERNDFDEGDYCYEIGFVAEEAEDAGLEDFVVYSENGETFSFDYYKFSAVAHQAVLQKQRDQINTLQSENEGLRADLEAIKAHLGLDK